jgi:acyl-[acyl carrier protein]--UDP-N-acetylglucosamine O-acyltransferase
VIVNTGATVDHDCRLGDFVHVAPGAHLCGGVTVDEGALLGVGCAVAPGVRIGAWATVGAAAAVVADVPAGATVIGVPAQARPPR